MPFGGVFLHSVSRVPALENVPPVPPVVGAGRLFPSQQDCPRMCQRAKEVMSCSKPSFLENTQPPAGMC